MKSWFYAAALVAACCGVTVAVHHHPGFGWVVGFAALTAYFKLIFFSDFD